MTDASQARADRQSLEDSLAEDASRAMARFLVAVEGEARQSLTASAFGSAAVRALWQKIIAPLKTVLPDKVADAVFAKASEAKTRAALEKALAFEGATQWQALVERHARNAATRQFAERQLARFEAEGVTAKRWDADLDNATRPTHRAADGQLAALSEPFEVGGFAMQYPGDPEAPPEETENCRCVIVGAQVASSVIAAVYSGQFEHSSLWHPRGKDGKFIPHFPHKGEVAGKKLTPDQRRRLDAGERAMKEKHPDLFDEEKSKTQKGASALPPEDGPGHEELARRMADGQSIDGSELGKKVHEAVQGWTLTEMTPGQEADFEKVVASAPPSKVPLYRGLFAQGSERKAGLRSLIGAKPGDTVESDQMSSWSDKEGIGLDYGLGANLESDTGDSESVLLVAEPGITALPISSYVTGSFGYLKEHVAAPANFTVVSNVTEPSGLHVITVRKGPS